MPPSFEDLVAEGAAVPTEGWDFSWFAGRATEARPSWGYAYFLGPQPEEVRAGRHPERERAAAQAAGLEVVDLRAERLRMEFRDIAAVVHFLRKVVWMVPGFTVEAYEDALRALHERIVAEGPFVAHSTRHLIEARKPL
ncbi:hypothetical protein E0E62_23270 [Streptomyces sp. 16-176A]